jgi:integrase
MQRRPFYLHVRNGYWYVEFVDPETSQRLTAKSTGCRDRDSATVIATRWLLEGIPQKSKQLRSASCLFGVEEILKSIRNNDDLTVADAVRIGEALKKRGLFISYLTPGSQSAECLADFLVHFWNFEESPFLQEKRLHGKAITRAHSKECLQRVELYWRPYFKDKRLAEITRSDLKNFGLYLAGPERGLKYSTINRILILGKTAIRWAFENDIIKDDVTKGVQTFSGVPQKRGILEPEETVKLFAEGTWIDERVKLASLVAFSCGMRQGEILALRPEDIGEDVIHVRHSWSEIDGIKAPKNGEARNVPVLPEVRMMLMEQAANNPHSPDGFIFWSMDVPGRPMTAGPLLRGLKIALTSIGIDYRERHITFHSFRHLYCTVLSERLNAKTVMLSSGHKSAGVFASYSDHETKTALNAVGEAALACFGNVVKFRAVNE